LRPHAKSGPYIFLKLLNIISSFFEKTLDNRIKEARISGNTQLEKETSELKLKVSPLLSLRKESNVYLKPSHQQTNESFRISPQAANEIKLLSEIAHFMASRNIEEVNDNSVKEVVDFLNSDGDQTLRWTNPYNRKVRTKTLKYYDNKDYFNEGNTKPLMVKVLGDLVYQKVYQVMLDMNIFVINDENAIKVSTYLKDCFILK